MVSWTSVGTTPSVDIFDLKVAVMKVGLIQSRGIGNIIIALSIPSISSIVAMKCFDRSMRILYRHSDLLRVYVEFLPLKKAGDWLVQVPFERLKERAC
jgi:hypothetical protein